MIRFTAWGANLLSVAQGRALIGEWVLTRDGALLSFLEKSIQVEKALK